MTNQPADLLDLSDRLRRLMNDCDMTVSELAEAAGVSKSAMEKYLAGPSSPRAQVIARLCERTGVTADWLLLGFHDPYPAFIRSQTMAATTALLSEVRYSPEVRERLFAGSDDDAYDAIRELAGKLEHRVFHRVRDLVARDKEVGGGLAFGAAIPFRADHAASDDEHASEDR